MKLSLILLSHNRLSSVEKCVKSIFSFIRVPCELIIIDDNSDGAVKKYLKSITKSRCIKRVKTYFYNNRINNIARNRNKGIELSTGDFIYFLADDYELLPGSTEIILDSFNLSPRIGVVGPVYLSSEKEIQFCGSYLEVEKPVSRILSFGDFVNMFEVDHITGMIRRSILKETGVYDEAFPLYGEDVEFSFRVKARGFKIFCQPRAAILHHRDIYKGSSRGFEDDWKRYTSKHNLSCFRFLRSSIVSPPAGDSTNFPYKYE